MNQSEATHCVGTLEVTADNSSSQTAAKSPHFTTRRDRTMKRPHEKQHNNVFVWTEDVDLELTSLPPHVNQITLVATTDFRGLRHYAFGFYRSPLCYMRSKIVKTERNGSQHESNKTLASSKVKNESDNTYVNNELNTSPCVGDEEEYSPITLKLSKQRCLGGTYCGIEAEGLFWSMKPLPDARPGARILPSADQLVDINITAYDRYFTTKQITSDNFEEEVGQLNKLCSIVINRSCYDKRLVQRTEVKTGRIRGAIFRPSNNCKLNHGLNCVAKTEADNYNANNVDEGTIRTKKFPAVIDLYGYGGGLMEHRAALSAQEGIVSFALAFFNYSDLDKQLQAVDIDYFEEAIDYLLSQPDVCGPRVSVVGLSKGAEIACLIASRLPEKISGCIHINGTHFTMLQPVIQPSRGIESEPPQLSDYPPDQWEMTNVGVAFRRFFSTHDMLLDGNLQTIPIERSDPVHTKFLFVLSGSDLSTDQNHVEHLLDRLERHGRIHQAEVLRLPGASHIVEPPYMPICRRGRLSHMKAGVDYGGDPQDHVQCQKIFWDKFLSFVKSPTGAHSES